MHLTIRCYDAYAENKERRVRDEEQKFEKWYGDTYNGDRLLPWQASVVEAFLSETPKGSGKTYLLRILDEYFEKEKFDEYE